MPYALKFLWYVNFAISTAKALFMESYQFSIIGMGELTRALVI